MSPRSLSDARSIGFLAVETCSKAVFALAVVHGKSPCFSRMGFLRLVGVGAPVLVLALVDVGVFLEYAF
jgi:hypothetical protein